MMSREQCHFCFMSFLSVYILRFCNDFLLVRAFSYSSFDISKTCLFEELFDKRLLIDVGSCFIICGGWFHEVLTHSSWSFDFLHGLHVPSNKLNATSKKSTICKFVFISILTPAFLKISIMFFRIRFAFCLDVFLKVPVHHPYTNQ